jgi:NAD(P)-dependent dehydrogenase (short-subunit alcohol dehydrogenase family)
MPQLADTPADLARRMVDRRYEWGIAHASAEVMAKLKGWLQRSALVTGASLGLWLIARPRRFQLKGRVVLITGGSRGLGLLIARELAGAGCRLVICARDQRELDQAAGDLTARGAQVLAVRCDVSAPDEVEQLVLATLQRFGAIDVLINNAGVLDVGPLESMTVADFDAALAVNFWGTVYASFAVLPLMRAQGDGRIVNITSIGGKVAVPHLLPYDAAKFAAVGFSEGLAAEVAKDGIVVTTVVPGLMRTGSPINVAYHGEPAREYLWFTLGDLTPLTSMNAVRAARRIVRALQRGEAEVTLGWQAKLLRLAHALMPATTIRGLALINRMLPSGGDSGVRQRGHEIGLPRAIERFIRSPAEQANQYSAQR